MIWVHMILGWLTVLMSIVVVVWNGLRLSGRNLGRGPAAALTGLLDLQVLIGIITYALHPVGGRFWFHPLFMIIAVALGHILLRAKRPVAQQAFGAIAILIVLLIGVLTIA